MQVLMVKIHQHEEHLFELTIDNLSREDSSDKEKAIADELEKLLSSLTERLLKSKEVDKWAVNGTRYKEAKNETSDS